MKHSFETHENMHENYMINRVNHTKNHFHFKVLSLVLIMKNALNSIRIQLTELSCVLKEIGMSKRPTEFALFKKHFKPITLECATSTLNTLSIKFLNSFYWGLFVGCLSTTA